MAMFKKVLLVSVLTLMVFSGFAQTEKLDASALSERSVCFCVNSNMYDWHPFDSKIGLTVYGSEYRKALSRLGWGKTLTLGIAPGLLCIAALINERDLPGVQIINAGLAAACLGTGIPLWVKGRKGLDMMLDDYSRNYTPLPMHSSTGDSFGIKLDF